MDSECDSESSRPLKLLSEDLDGSTSSKHSLSSDAEVIGGNSISGSENHSVNVDRSNMQSTLFFDSEAFNGHSSSKASTEHSETSIRILDLFARSKSVSESSSSVASSSSSASLKPVFRVEANERFKHKTHIVHSQRTDEDTKLKLRKGKDCSAEISLKVEHDSDCSGATTSPVSEVTHESILYSMSPTQSPPIQVMDRSAGYEPHRIPSSVFARSKSSTPVEWSIASNESLFSIQIGNNSFSRDHVAVLGNDLLKSGELIKSSELFSLSPPPIADVPSNDNKVVHVEKSREENTKSVGLTNDMKKKIGDNGFKEKPSPTAVVPNSSQHSDESGGTSARSFTFPIKKKGSCPKPSTWWMRKIFLCPRKKCAQPSCHCSNCTPRTFCRWPSCFCRWPSCHCKCPSCKCPSCKCSSCYCPKCSCVLLPSEP